MPELGEGRGAGRLPRPVRGAMAAVAGVAGLGLLAQGMAMSFHVENTAEAMSEAAQGSTRLAGSAVLLLASAGLSRYAGAGWVPAALVGLPVVAGVVPALLLSGNVLPFLTALLSGAVALAALVWVVVTSVRRRSNA